MTISRSTARIEAAISDAVGELLDDREAELVAAWVRAWDSVSGELVDVLQQIVEDADGQVSASLLTRSERLGAAIAALADSLVNVAGEAAEGIAADLRTAVQLGETGTVAMITDQLPAQITASVVGADAGQITAMLERSIENITADMAVMPVEQAAIIRAELNRGITVGANPRETARRITRQVEGRFNYGLHRAMVASRTETMDAHRNAAQAAEEANTDVLDGWRWECHLGTRTCRACLAKHGDINPIDTPGPEGHQQCRCARVPVTKAWAELGFPDLDEPDPLFTDAGEWFDSLSAGDQKAILGRKGFEAWQAGDYPMTDWVARQDNPGWRPSYVATTPT